jgi:hypothetical protein
MGAADLRENCRVVETGFDEVYEVLIVLKVVPSMSKLTSLIRQATIS